LTRTGPPGRLEHERYRASLELNIHTVRYEDLVADLDGIAAKIFSFLNCQPDESYRHFHKLNAEQIIRTPSQSQVTQPIYVSSGDRWKNYLEYLEPHIPIVRPIAYKYGYAIWRRFIA
jgi:hypothetical protein